MRSRASSLYLKKVHFYDNCPQYYKFQPTGHVRDLLNHVTHLTCNFSCSEPMSHLLKSSREPDSVLL